jgi:hypothetical protein
MGYFKNLAIELEESGEMPDPESEDPRAYGKRKKKATLKPVSSKPVDDYVPMSINSLFDNARDWLDEEPWRTW